ncbi:MAG: hypothetical protein HYS13_25600 [Planctomycetia bacterium]|nr:hypothetical protein [Planctomycetia bacterium]
MNRRGPLSGFASALAIALLLPVLAPAWSAAQEDPLEKTSLAVVPEDAGFCSVLLEPRALCQKIAGSRAGKTLLAQPAVIDLRNEIERTWEGLERDDDPPPLRWLKQPENEPLRALLVDMASHEVFCYGEAGWADLYDLYQRSNNVQNFTMLSFLMRGRLFPPPSAEQELFKAYADLMLGHRDVLTKPPALVVGFRVEDVSRAKAQLDRLEQLIRTLPADGDAAWLRGAVKRARIGEGDFLTCTITGKMIEEIVGEDFVKNFLGALQEDLRPEYEKLLADFRETISVGVWRNYVIVSASGATDHLAKLGTGKPLYGRAELAPVRSAPSPPVSVGYTSADFQRRMRSDAAVDELLKHLDRELQAAPLDDDARRNLQAELQDVRAQVEKTLPPPAPTVDYCYLSPSGVEAYSIHFDQPAAPARPLTILEHLGRKPLFFAAGRSNMTMDDWRGALKALRSLVRVADALVLARSEGESRQQYEFLREKLAPLAERLEKATLEEVLPGLDGQLALVVGGDVQIPGLPKVPGVALVWGVENARKLEEGIGNYVAVAREIVAAVREMHFQFAGLELPEAEATTSSAGTIYAYPPIGGLDDLRLAAGLVPRAAVVTLGAKNAEQFLTRTPLDLGVPLADKDRGLLSVVHLDVPQVVDAAQPWFDFGLFFLAPVVDDPESLASQVHVGLDIARCVRGITSVSYQDGKALVTHTRIVMRDLEMEGEK